MKMALLNVDNFKYYNNGSKDINASANKYIKALKIKMKKEAKKFGGDSQGDFICPCHMYGDEFMVKFHKEITIEQIA